MIESQISTRCALPTQSNPCFKRPNTFVLGKNYNNVACEALNLYSNRIITQRTIVILFSLIKGVFFFATVLYK